MSTPVGEIYLLSMGNQLSSDMHHTYRFNNATEQKTFFGIGTDGGMVKRFSPTQYIRVSENEVKVPYPKEAIEGRFSYMAIVTKDSTEERIWYAFIIDLEYISDRATKITYKIDPIQTFIFGGGAEIREAHVARCHADTDIIGDNRVAEPFSVPSYVYNEIVNDYYTSGCIIGIIEGQSINLGDVTVNTTPKTYYGGRISSSSTYFGFNLENSSHVNRMKALITSVNHVDGIITDFYFCPYELFDEILGSDNTINDWTPAWDNVQLSSVNITAYGDGKLEGYTPKNNKMFTYPYNILAIDNTAGTEMHLKFEEFNTTPTLRKEGTWLPNSSVQIVPLRYEGTDANHICNYNYGASLRDFPMSSFASNAYNTWVAQKEQAENTRLLTRTITGIASLGVAPIIAGALSLPVSAPMALIAGAVGFAASSFNNIANIEAEKIQAKNTPDKEQQDISGGAMTIANQHCGFRYSRKTVNAYFAEIVDNYFTQFGYAQDKIMNVNSFIFTKTRTRFKYIQTDNAHFNGACANRYKDELETIFNRGVTFWESNQIIGNYSDANPTVS